MITLRRSAERRHDRRRKQEVWQTFYPTDGLNLTAGFGTLELLNEYRLPSGAGVPRLAHNDVEIVTYVREGTLGLVDSMGHSGVIQAGEFQRMTAGSGIVRHSKPNGSRHDWTHLFQIWLRSSKDGLDPSHEQKRFSAAERRGELRIVASPDAQRGSLRIHQDALLYSAILDPGQHLAHALAPNRTAWLHLVQGEVRLGDLDLSTGDGAGVTAEAVVSFTAREESEILLFDLGEQAPRPTNGAAA